MFAYKPHSATSSPHPQQVPVESLVKGTRRASRQQIRRRRNRASLAANALNNGASEKQGLGVALARNPVGNDLENLSVPAAGTIQKILYLTGGDGSLFAMYVIDQNNQGKMYYIYTDHLGSPNLITDAECNVVQELSFDACCVKLGFCEHSETKSLVEPIPSLRKGNKRNPVTWQPYIGTMPQALYIRGYTMHEHLANFGLIDMLSAAKSRGEAYAGKGRVGVYPERCNRFGNPLVGHFLSADPFIQAPEFSLSFNRYSYCLNNPLLYTDPTGFFAEGPDVDASGLSNNFDGSNDLGSANSGAESGFSTTRGTTPPGWWIDKENNIIASDGNEDETRYLVSDKLKAYIRLLLFFNGFDRLQGKTPPISDRGRLGIVTHEEVAEYGESYYQLPTKRQIGQAIVLDLLGRSVRSHEFGGVIRDTKNYGEMFIMGRHGPSFYDEPSPDWQPSCNTDIPYMMSDPGTVAQLINDPKTFRVAFHTHNVILPKGFTYKNPYGAPTFPNDYQGLAPIKLVLDINNSKVFIINDNQPGYGTMDYKSFLKNASL